MTPADAMLRIAQRLDRLGSDVDAARLREIVRDILAWQERYREVESLTARLCQCQGELTHLREVVVGMEPRRSNNQDPKSKRLK